MNTLKNVAKMLLQLFWGAYITTLTAGALWLMYQPEPWLPEVPGLAMVVGGEAFDMGAAGMFCSYGIAWDETGVMGLNVPVVEGGKLLPCNYTKNIDDWAYRMGPASEYTDL